MSLSVQGGLPFRVPMYTYCRVSVHLTGCLGVTVGVWDPVCLRLKTGSEERGQSLKRRRRSPNDQREELKSGRNLGEKPKERAKNPVIRKK